MSALLTKEFLKSLHLEHYVHDLADYVFMMDVRLATVSEFEALGMTAVEGRRLVAAAQEAEKLDVTPANVSVSASAKPQRGQVGMP